MSPVTGRWGVEGYWGTGTLLAAGSREFGPGFEPDAEVIGQEGVLVPSAGKGVEDWADHGRFRRRDR